MAAVVSLSFCPCCAQLGESPCESLQDTADEVSLKLSLWQGGAEFEDLTSSWCSMLFDQLDVPAVEEAVVR